MKNPFKKNDHNIPPSYTQPPAYEGHKKSNVKNGLKSVYSTVAILVAAPLLALVITSHVFHSYEVDGASMSKTLENGDRLIVNKIPKTISNIFGSTYMPNRWDIVVFDRPGSVPGNSNVSHLIKRVIAIPGERVTVENGEVTVYNQENPEGFNPDNDDTQDYRVNLPASTPGTVDITVGLGEVFVLGDNRVNSTDSRVFGAIPTSKIVGNATFRFIPINQMDRL